MMVDERLEAIAYSDACHLSEQDAMGSKILGLDNVTVKARFCAKQNRCSGRDRFPLAELEALFLWQTGEAGEGIGNRLLGCGKGVQRKDAIVREKVVVR